MNALTNLKNIIRKGIVAGVATTALLSLTASPAHAATFTASRFDVDVDNVVVGRSTTNDYKAFDGTFESWHNGQGISGRVRGGFVGRGDLHITSTYHDGGTITSSFSSAGVHRTLDLQMPSNGASLVRVQLRWVADQPNSNHVDNDMTYFVGDAPQSTGNCNQLDTDVLNVSNANAIFAGSVKWACNASTGRVTARVEGELTRRSQSTKNSYIGGHITYSDGTTTPFLSKAVTGRTAVVLVPVNSNQNKHPRYVDVSIFGDSTSEPRTEVKLGDA